MPTSAVPTQAVTRAERVTLDASVWLAALWTHEAGHADAVRCMEHVDRQQIRMLQPTLFLPEVCGAMRRQTGRDEQAAALAQTLLCAPLITMCPLTADVAGEAAACALRLGLRGADAVYVATARMEQSTLITLDLEVIERARVLIDVVSPGDWLERTAQQLHR